MDKQEFSLAIEIILQASGEKEFVSDIQLRKLFDVFDSDGNGTIDLREFIEGLKMKDTKKTNTDEDN